jgi:predicted nuclease of restriction endonuclease-like (RecB) superfamily
VKKQRKAKIKQSVAKTKRATTSAKRRASPTDYGQVLADMKRLIADSRHRALATVNRELVCLYWHIGRVIVQQQETANWGDAVVEQLATNLQLAFPDMKGFSRDNVFRMRQFFVSCRDLDGWFAETLSVSEMTTTVASRPQKQKVGALSRQLPPRKVATASPQSLPDLDNAKVGTLSRQFASELGHYLTDVIAELVLKLSWSHHYIITGTSSDPDERYFYMAMSVRERWSVRELRRQIGSGLFLRYMSVKRDPEKCLPTDAEVGDLLPFKDHYVLEFLGLSEEHSERELRKAILANLRDFFLEFGRDLTFVGEEYPLTIGKDTFHIVE